MNDRTRMSADHDRWTSPVQETLREIVLNLIGTGGYRNPNRYVFLITNDRDGMAEEAVRYMAGIRQRGANVIALDLDSFDGVEDNPSQFQAALTGEPTIVFVRPDAISGGDEDFANRVRQLHATLPETTTVLVFVTAQPNGVDGFLRIGAMQYTTHERTANAVPFTRINGSSPR